ncbi:MAG: hypothetical protein V1791_12700 [Pseudomonadota bacterium]
MLKMFRYTHPHRLINWYRRLRAFGHARKQSDYRAACLAQRLVLSGSLQNNRLTGAPLVRYQKQLQGENV